MKLQLTRGVLIGAAFHEAGEVVEAPPRLAERLTRSGAAFPAPASPAAVENAGAPRRGERAVSNRQAAG